MVSKWEVLEYILKYGPQNGSKLREVFGISVCYPLNALVRSGLLVKYYPVFEKTSFGVRSYRVYLKPNERKYYISEYDLTDKAYEILRRCGVNSFLETRYAKLSKNLYLNREWKKI